MARSVAFKRMLYELLIHSNTLCVQYVYGMSAVAEWALLIYLYSY